MKRKGLFLFCMVFASAVFSSPIFALTLSDIRDHVRLNIHDTATDATLQAFSDTILNGFINEAQRDVITQTWAVEASSSLVLTAGTVYYDLPSDLIAVKRVAFATAGGITSNLDEVTLSKLNIENPDFENQSGQPTEYLVRLPSTAGDTALSIAYIPVPTSASTGTVYVDYYAQAEDLSADADVPFNGLLHLYPYHDALVFYVTARIKILQGRSDEGANYIQLYQATVAAMNDKLNKMPNYHPNLTGAPGVGR